MEEEQRKRLVKQRAVAKASLTCMQRYLETGERKLNQLQVRYEELPNILSKFELAQTELETSEDIDYSIDRELFEEQYYYVKEKFMELMYPENLLQPAANFSAHDSGSAHSSNSSKSNQLTQTVHQPAVYQVKLPSIELPSFDGTISKWLHFRDTFDSLIIVNQTLSNVQKLHYLIASLTGEAKNLIANLPITHDNFLIAWELITQRYNNFKLIAMTHVKQLFQLPQVKRNDASTLRHLVNHVSSNMNAIQALSLKTSTHDLILNHLLLSVLDAETHREWELQTSMQPDIPPTAQVIEFLEARCKALELLQANQSTGTTPQRLQSAGRVSYSRCHVTTQTQCPLCKGTHKLHLCSKFIKMFPNKRFEYVKQIRACYNCLQPFSKQHTCSKFTCRVCNKFHHTMLHVYLQNKSAVETRPTNGQTSAVTAKDNAPAEVNSYCSIKCNSTNHVLLATAIVEVKSRCNQYVPCRVLLDSASQVNFITERCVQRLRLNRNKKQVSIQGVNNVNTATHHSVSIHLRSRRSNWHASINCAVLPHITSNTPASRLDTTTWKLPTDIQLADENFNEPSPIDLLIGADLFYDILLSNRRTKEGHPVLQETVLGWIISGKTPAVNLPNNTQHSFFVREDNSLENNLNRLWEIEPVEQSSLTSEQQACEQHFSTHTTLQSGKFVVRLPFKEDPNQLGMSRRSAENRLHSIERRLDRDITLKTDYHHFMREYEESGHMTPVDSHDGTQPCYYLPHHPVFKETSTTTKTRVVFDGSAKSSNGLSLNDILLVGPTVQPDLYSTVLRFRTHQICFTADIAKMYRQILIHPQDRDFQRILWRYSPDHPVSEYQLNTVTYGTSAAPFLATRCLKKLAEDNQSNFPRAAQALSQEFYVDDLLSGATTLNEAVQLQQQLTSLLQTAGFTLRKWASNSQEFLHTIPDDYKASNQALSFDNKDGVTALGLLWLPSTDHLQVRQNNSALMCPANNTSQKVTFQRAQLAPGHNAPQQAPLQRATLHASTKRQVLGIIASIFDPLGLISPSVIVYKIFLQKLWQDNLLWDEQLINLRQEEWNQLIHTLPKISQICIPRKVICTNVTNIQLHGFCDASEQAYGACIYVRSTDHTNQVFNHLLCSSSRVAPLKKLTIPRLELCAAVLLAKLYKRVTSALNMINASYLWTDSSIVLTWIQGPSHRWKTFVGNRVAFIQERTTSAIWQHVSTQHNPADLISRGADPTTLATSTLWWNGPEWITLASTDWPVTDFNPPTEILETKKVHVARHVQNNFIQKFSRLKRLLRVTAYCKRFLFNCRQQAADRRTTPLTTQEIDQALTCCIRSVQQTTYAKELEDLTERQEVATSSSLKALHPFIDNEGVLRVGGRLQQSNLPYHTIHQTILPPNHHLTRLIVLSEHIRLHHAGPQLLIASLRDTIWIPRIRNTVKSVINQCLTCYRFKQQASQQLMGELPSTRVQPARAFYTTGIDYAGPIVIRQGSIRSKSTEKGYIAIFVCFVTKAVHIEVVTSLTTEAFLAALRRFIARRGRPRIIYSDNGTNFQGASNQLQEVYNMLQCPTQIARVQDFLTSEGCDWKFIPPHGPHFGGLWEAAVKSMKYHLRRTLGAQIATYEELSTLLSEIEACLNSRPICVLPNDPHSSYLSPGHFLIGQPLTQLPSIDFTDIKLSRLSRWQTFQQQLQNFWKRWSADYLHELQSRQRWQRSSPNVQVGDAVILRELNTAPLHWPTAVITAVHPGQDGKTRVVTVKTSTGTFKRPIVKICPLPHVKNEL